jgi:hypothetical protein
VSDIRAALLGRLPSGDGNGLSAVASDLARDPSRIRAAVVLFDADRIVEKTDDGNHEVRVRVRRVEVISAPDDADALQRILMREFERRTGQTVLPIDLEEDVKAAFADLDPDALAAEERPVDDPADHLQAMKNGESAAVCASCGVELRWDEAVDGWLDRNGFPAADGHRHEPAGAEAGETE